MDYDTWYIQQCDFITSYRIKQRCYEYYMLEVWSLNNESSLHDDKVKSIITIMTWSWLTKSLKYILHFTRTQNYKQNFGWQSFYLHHWLEEYYTIASSYLHMNILSEMWIILYSLNRIGFWIISKWYFCLWSDVSIIHRMRYV